MTPGWRPAHALRRAVLLCVLLPAVAVIAGRPDVLVLGAPLLLGTVLAVLAFPDRAGAPRAVAVAPSMVGQGQWVPVSVDVELPPGTQAAVVRLPLGDVLPFGTESGVAGGDGAAPVTRRLSGRVGLRRWGRVLLARPDVRAIGPDALLLHDPVPGPERTVRVLPALGRPVPAPLPARSGGVAGAHRTRRPGEGTDLLDVREFRPGDRMRRIDWRVSARRGTLHVRRTAVDADADVVLALDTRLDVGAAVRLWPTAAGSGQVAAAPWRALLGRSASQGPGAGAARWAGSSGAREHGSSLDVTVRTAASLASSFLSQGDRVTVLDLSRPRLSTPPGTGRRHLRRVRRQLAEVAVAEGANRLLVRPGAVPGGAVVLVMSPFLDEPPAELAQRLARRGALVVAVDVLPSVDPAQPVRRDEVAGRLVLAERVARLEALRGRGIRVCRGDAALVARLLRDDARRRQRVAR